MPRASRPLPALSVAAVATTLVVVTLLAACGPSAPADAREPAPPTTGPGPSAGGAPAGPVSARALPATAGPAPPGLDDWQVGATPLPPGRDGYGKVEPTPPELRVRRLPSPDVLPPPESGQYESSISPVPRRVLARSTWKPQCPVPVDELRYLTMSFVGFDGRAHTGEMIVNADVARKVVGVFARLFAARFPIERMRVVSPAELDAPPTGDGNNTTSFVCRSAVGLGRWSAHAYGLAVDVNVFQNPYVRGELVLPELASAYLDRDWRRPGMVREGGPVVAAFDDIGWTWGGRWDTPIDYQHFSATGG